MENNVQDLATNMRVHYMLCPVQFYVDLEIVQKHRIPLYFIRNEYNDQKVESNYCILMSTN